MKTITLKFVVDDSDEDSVNDEIQGVLENTGLNSFPLHSWRSDSANKQEIKWRKKYDKER